MTRHQLVHQNVRIHVDDVYLEGDLHVPLSPVGMVLFAHGSGSSRLSPRNNYVAARLQENGIGTLLIDLLTADEDREFSIRFDIELLTLRLAAAVNWMRLNEDIQSQALGLFGASTGAAAALQLAAFFRQGRDDGIAAVVSRGGRPDLASQEALQTIIAPTLLIVGGEDSEVIGLNEQAYALMRCEKRLQIIPGATHLFEESGALEKVSELAVSWFLRHLTSPSLPNQKIAR
jgi:putative phosphoribosyl transferase